MHKEEMKGKTYLLKVAYLCIVLLFFIHEIKGYTWQISAVLMFI